MKNILIIFFVVFCLPLWAQDSRLTEERRNEFEAQKVAFFTQKLELTPAEAAVFWPLYNEMWKKIREKEGEVRSLLRKTKDTPEPTEAQMQKVVKEMLELEQQMLDIKKDYYHQMMKTVSAEKVYKLTGVEHKFHKQLLEKLKNQSPRRK